MGFEKMWLLVHHHTLVHLELGCLLYHSFPNKRPLYIVGTLHTLPPYTTLFGRGHFAGKQWTD